MRFRILIAAAVLAATAPAVPAICQSGPSYDCRKARTWVEKTICKSRSLSAKDQRMATAYRSFIEQMEEGGGPGADTSAEQDRQRRWLVQRNRCRTSACLHAAYDRRISDMTVDY